MFENGSKGKNDVDPTTLQPINYDLPPMTAEEVKQTLKLWLKIASIKKICELDDPKVILDLIADEIA